MKPAPPGAPARQIDAALAVAERSGVPATELLAALRSSFAARQATNRVAAEATVGARWSVRVLVGLAAVVGVMGWTGGSGPGVAAGPVVIAQVLGLGALGAGWWWSRRLIAGMLRSVDPPSCDSVLVARVLVAAMRAGMPLPAALIAAADVLDGMVRAGAARPSTAGGRGLAVLGHALGIGVPWQHAREAALADGPDLDLRLLEMLCRSWNRGTPIADDLIWFARAEEEGRASQVRSRAAELGVKAVLPLGLCFLPGFVLVGVVPWAAALWGH